MYKESKCCVAEESGNYDWFDVGTDDLSNVWISLPYVTDCVTRKTVEGERIGMRWQITNNLF